MTPQEAALAALASAARDLGLVEAEVAKARQKLDRAICEAYEAGVKKMDLHRISGLSRPTVDKILVEG